jgi:hypothetical protein
MKLAFFAAKMINPGRDPVNFSFTIVILVVSLTLISVILGN